ncbi:MAG TPA: ankyrin repeat domain-containing protein [Vicinamibacterales bacterium]|nr:ankyrin repeat domain-containing protein [Vicinamibacterales bacterium]
MYRVAPATRLIVFGGLAVLAVAWAAATLSLRQVSAARYVWIATGVSALLLAVVVRRRLAARASEYIQIADDAITASGPAGFRTLPWASIALLTVTRGGALELSDASRTHPIVVSRRFEPFPALVADVVGHLAAAYAHRKRGARTPPAPDALTFGSSVAPEVLQVLGSLTWTAAIAWLSPLEFLLGLARRPLAVSWLDPLAFVLGLAWIPLALWGLARAPYAVTVRPAALTLATLAGTREIPIACIAAVELLSDDRGRPAIVIADTSGERTAFVISRLTERPLELYDVLRRLHEGPAAAAAAGVMGMRLEPVRGAAFIAACAVVGLAVASIPIFNGGVLRFAAAHGYARAAKAVLRLGSPVDYRGTTQMTPLCLASRDGHLPIVRLLLAHGADPAGQCRDAEFTPLHVATQNGHGDIVRALLDRGVSPDVANRYGRTALSHLAWMNRPTAVDMAALLLDRGASIDLADNEGFAPIHWAVMGKSLPMIRSLVARGARLDARTTEGSTASMDAVRRGCVECLRLLLQGGADVNARSATGQTLLRRAAFDGNPDIIAMLLEAGARPNVAASDGYDALQTAVWNGHKEAVAMMLAHGADINAVTEKGTALYAAVQRKQPEILALLLDRGARWDLGYHDLTPLQRAARGGETAMVRMMLDRGADPNASTATQPPPIVLAADEGHLAVVTLLVDRGADVRVRWKDWTPMRAAQAKGRGPVVEYLRARGSQ